MEATVTIKLTTDELNTLRKAVKVYEDNCTLLREGANGQQRHDLGIAIVETQKIAKVLG